MTSSILLFAAVLVALTAVALSQGNVMIVGNNDRAVRLTPAFTLSKKMIMVDSTFVSGGYVFGFGVYFISAKPIWIQIYRLTPGTLGTYQLLYALSNYTAPANKIINAQSLMQPYANLRTDILIKDTSANMAACPLVQAGDRLVILTEDGLPVANVFDATAQSRSNDWLVTPAVMGSFTWDQAASVPFVYRLALMVAYDTDPTWYRTSGGATCNPNLALPSANLLTTLPPPPSTTMDLRGPKGDTGATGAAGPPGSAGAPGNNGATGPTGPAGPGGPSGQPGASGSVGGPGATGLTGAQGIQGPRGDRGMKGDLGPGGSLGPSGPAGPPGPAGPVGPKGAGGNAGGTTQQGGAVLANTDSNCACGQGLLHPNLILGLIVWLLILTLLVIMLLILMTRKARREEKNRDSFRSLQRESPWMDGLREDTWKDYNIETVSQGH